MTIPVAEGTPGDEVKLVKLKARPHTHTHTPSTKNQPFSERDRLSVLAMPSSSQGLVIWSLVDLTIHLL